VTSLGMLLSWPFGSLATIRMMHTLPDVFP
jgi:hypothetical protein